MKKLVKVSFVIAVSIMLLGIIIYVIGFVGGGQNDVNSMVENGELSYYFFTGWTDDNTAIVDNAETKEQQADGQMPVEAVVMKGNEEAAVTAEGVEKMVLELGRGEIHIETGEVRHIQISTGCEEQLKVSVENHVLRIEGFETEGRFFHTDIGSDNRNGARIVIPKELAFERTEISAGAGRMELTGLSLGDTDAEVGVGELRCTDVKAEKLAVDVGAGAAYLENIEAKESDISVAMGEAVLSGSFNGNMALEVAMGSLMVTVNGKEEDFNYRVDAALGSAEIAGKNYESLASEKEIENGADKTIDAEVSMGNLEISFTE